jgi:hypothetical protein
MKLAGIFTKSRSEHLTASVSFVSLSQFYDTDDPSPDAERALSDRAEDKIIHAYLDVPKGHHVEVCDRIAIQFPNVDMTPEQEVAIVSAVRSHFSRRAVEIRRATKLTVRIGLREFRLTIAVCIPSFAGIALLTQFPRDPIPTIIENVLVIFCWVVIWQPFQSLVFDRWTQAEQAILYEMIAEGEITVIAMQHQS